MIAIFDLIVGDCLDVLRAMPTDSVDMVFCSPPYEDARSYGIGIRDRGQQWVDWCVPIYSECVRVSRGLVAWVVEGRTTKFRYSATPALLMADLHRAGIRLRKPPIYYRSGIPGSGGPDWWNNKWEWIVCASKGRLPWSDNTATGHPPKCPPGGNPSHYGKNERVGKRNKQKRYKPPERANPGNVIFCHGGGGHMGDRLAHENEAPFPEDLVWPFMLSYCPPDGIVCDPFCGSGTTLAVAKKLGRRGIGIDLRKSQIELTARRLAGVTFEGFNAFCDEGFQDVERVLRRRRSAD